jgi:hypothetical protein
MTIVRDADEVEILVVTLISALGVQFDGIF